ncbi:Uncharacterised protein [Gordonia paraffinivorans]|uniref:Uncharacterized protein n=1 Tax=Gordonia paraffinivorans TaxID=175628 RepID=A0ABD7UYF6_9ACTN|nr:Uncharacterised protein [Gordonia paraffinivorans]
MDHTLSTLRSSGFGPDEGMATEMAYSHVALPGLLKIYQLAREAAWALAIEVVD